MKLHEQVADLKKRVEKANQEEREERTRRYQLENDLSESKNKIISLQDQLSHEKNSSVHWHSQLMRIEGYLEGMREILIGMGFTKFPPKPVVGDPPPLSPRYNP